MSNSENNLSLGIVDSRKASTLPKMREPPFASTRQAHDLCSRCHASLRASLDTLCPACRAEADGTVTDWQDDPPPHTQAPEHAPPARPAA
jgi:hypothetical protein